MSLLSSVTKGRQDRPFKVVVYSSAGLGKTTFAANAPASIILDIEGGTSFVDCARTPKVESLKEVLDFLGALAVESHSYRTVAIDTLDALEPLIWKHVIANDNPKYQAKTIEDVGGGYGKGYVAAIDQWRLVLGALDALYAKGMNVVLLAHQTVKQFKSPDITIDPFDRYEMKLNKSAAALVKEWPDALLFGDYEIATAEKDGRTKGISTGKRVLHTVYCAAWDAKNRYGLPPVIELNWQAFETAARASAAVSVEKVEEEIKKVLATKDVRTVEKATEALARAGGDLQKMTKLLNWIREQN